MPIPAFNRPTRTRLISAGGAVVAGAVALTCAVMPGTALAAAPSTYTVKSGDNLTAIAKAESVSGGWQAIANANHITSPYIIQVGQVLNLPSGNGTSTQLVKQVPVAASASTASTGSTSSSSYPNNLDGWIRQSLAIMQKNGIPGSYDGIYRNIMRESSGNPNAENDWDSNAAAGTPSKGLLQVIQPTFDAYHVAGTSWNLFDPVANITAACNYAYHVYGSMDNVNSAY